MQTQEKRTQIKEKGIRYVCISVTCLSAFLLTLSLYLLLKPQIEWYRRGTVAYAFIALTCAPTIALGTYWTVTKKLTYKRLTTLLIIVAFALRMGYVLYTPAATRQHDTFSPNFDGHEAYAWTIFSTGKLPTSNVYQFYHPPFNALLQAWFMRFMDGLTTSISEIFGLEEYFSSAFSFAKPSYVDGRRYFLFGSCQILSILYSLTASIFAVKTVNLFTNSTKTKGVLTAFVLLYPRQIQMAGSLNNDGPAYMFAVIALYTALQWWKGKKSWGYILCCAIAIGCGMMCKLSSATVCLPIAGIFIYEFVRTCARKEQSLSFGKIVGQYAAFLGVCAPLGLWFQVYAFLTFGQPFGYVFSNLNSALYTGDVSWVGRFIIPLDLKEWFGSLYCRPFDNYNLFHYALRSSIFGEYTYWYGEGFGVLSVLFAYGVFALLLFASVYAVVVYIKNGKRKGKNIFVVGLKEILFVALLVLSQVGSEVYFYITMPYGCTMDFRYIMPMILALALWVNLVEKVLANENGVLAKGTITWLHILMVGMIVSSSLFYCVCL